MPAATIPPIQRSSTSPTGSPTGGYAEDATSPAPPDITDRKLRAVAYVRESTEEQGQGFSPDAQRQSIRRFAPENNLELVGEYCDFHSGWRKSEAHPEFQRLMADAAAGKFDVVLVFHTSRFARNQVEARRYKQLLRERLGIRVVSVTQPMGEDHTDPSAFLAESVHEMFDEYYSVSLSFWTRSGLREKARQGHLVGSLPWGYIRDPTSKLAVRHTERAPLVLAIFERYATGQESDRTLAAWLNAKGARTARGRLFSKDTVREMLCNTAYAGYVSGLRDKSRAIKGLHEPIVSDELFDRVQEVRSWRTRVVKPSRPSDEHLLRKLIHCERCGARMHGCRTGWEGMRRYQCSTRRHHGDCEQKMTPAQPREEQLIDWLHDFQPDHAMRQLVLDAIQTQASTHPGEDAERRRELTGQLERLRDLYVMGDITKPKYVMQRQVLEEEMQREAANRPRPRPRADDPRRLHALLGRRARAHRATQADPLPVRAGLGQGQPDRGRKPNAAFANYFAAASEVRATHPKADAGDEATNTGATGICPWVCPPTTAASTFGARRR
jgi:site-specific DNA recombinase